NTLRVPVPVRSAFSSPCSSTCESKSRYWRISTHSHGWRATRAPQQPQPDENQRHGQYLPHRQPAEGQITNVRIRLAHEFHEEAEHAVKQREQARNGIARARLAREPPQHGEHHHA